MNAKHCLIIGGPTASGKSAWALDYARKETGVLINADCRQLDRDLPLLSAMPSRVEQAQIPHLLYGITSYQDVAWNAAIWAQQAARAIQETLAQGKTPILVGGTGFYILALTEGLSPMPVISDAARDKTQSILSSVTLEQAHHYLSSVDAQTAMRLHPNDKQRIQRALNIFHETGQPLSYWQTLKPEPLLKEIKIQCVRLLPPRDLLLQRIQKRAREMVENGVLDEVARLHALNLDPNHRLCHTIGYDACVNALEGRLTTDQLIETLVVETRQYAKRQYTWFQNQMQGKILTE